MSAPVTEVIVRAAPLGADGRRPEISGIAGVAAVTAALAEALRQPWRELGHFIQWEAARWAH